MTAFTPATQKQASVFRDLRATQLFQAMSAEEAFELFSASRKTELDGDTTLHLQDDPAIWFYYIVSGWVKNFRQMRSGEEAVMEITGSGEFVGELAQFEGAAYSCNAATVGKTVLLKFPLSLLTSVTRDNPAIALALMGDMSEKRLAYMRDVENLKLRKADQRIGCFLLRLCKGAPAGHMEFSLPYNKSLIAAQLGIRGETYSRAFERLRKATNVTANAGKIHIPNIEKLSAFVCSGCSNEYPCKDLVH